MDLSLLLAFWGVTFLLIVVPGPDWAFVLASGARDRVVLPAVAGLMLGYTLLALLVAAGIGALVGSSPILLTALTLVGAGYLIYLGISLLRHPGSLQIQPTQPATRGDRPSSRARVLRGVGVSGLNPKGLLIFIAMLPQFTDPSGSWPTTLQLITLGLIFVATCGAFYSVLGHSARTVLGTKPTATRLISRISGATMIIVGLVLLIERITT